MTKIKSESGVREEIEKALATSQLSELEQLVYGKCPGTIRRIPKVRGAFSEPKVSKMGLEIVCYVLEQCIEAGDLQRTRVSHDDVVEFLLKKGHYYAAIGREFGFFKPYIMQTLLHERGRTYFPTTLARQFAREYQQRATRQAV